MSVTTIKESVAAKVGALNPEIENAVVGVLVDQVKDKRTKAILGALALIDEKKKELDKIRPTKQFGVDGKVTNEFYTKQDIDNRAKVAKALGKLEAALGEALGEDAKYDKLFNLVQNKGNVPDDTPEGTETASE
jgi:hypothetical protein